MRKSSMMKKGLALGLSAAFILSLAGCGSSGESSGGSSGGSNTIRVGIWDNNQLAGLQQIADEWGEENGYDVEFQVTDWDTYWTMLEAGVQGGEMPDVFWMHSNNAIKYMQAGVMMDLNEYIENDDTMNIDDFYPDITDLYTLDGTHYAIPKDHDTIAVIYNKAVFDKYGIDYPTNDWTWQDFADIAQEINEKGAADGVYGTYCNSGDVQNFWYNIIYSFGGKVISDDKTESGFDDPATVEAMDFIANEILPGCPPQDAMANTGGDTMFQSGLLGMLPQGSFDVIKYYDSDNASDYGWVMMPYADVNGDGQCQKEERVSIYNGLGWAAYANTENPDAAYSLISAFCSEEGQKKQAELGVTLAGRMNCSDPFIEAYSEMDMTPFIDIEEEGTLVMRPYSKEYNWESDICNLLVTAWADPSTMDEVLPNVVETMNADLAEEND